MKNFIKQLASEFNSYSQLAALNYEQMKKGKCDEGTLRWNKGNLNRIEDYLKQLEYKTAKVVFDN